MAKCTETDLAALTESGPLLRFAAERVKDLDPDLSLAIAEARAAADADQWTPQVSQRFWSAFAKLCDLIQPVTMDCLAAAQRNVDPPRWLRWLDHGKKSIAERSSRKYLWVLFFLLALILPMQLYVWTCNNLSKKIDELLVAEKLKYATVFSDYARLQTEAADKKDSDLSAEHKALAFKIASAARSIDDGLDRVDLETYFLGRISTLTFLPERPSKSKREIHSGWKDSAEAVTARMGVTQSAILLIQEKANLTIGILGAYILPILFGCIGSVAYVIRTMSDQIKTTTFATSSPVRHFMRTALGAMAGLVVGLFGDFSTKLSVSPLAVAFLAGYGVEAVFSMFDGIIEKFKQAKSTS